MFEIILNEDFCDHGTAKQTFAVTSLTIAAGAVVADIFMFTGTCVALAEGSELLLVGTWGSSPSSAGATDESTKGFPTGAYLSGVDTGTTALGDVTGEPPTTGSTGASSASGCAIIGALGKGDPVGA